MGTYSYDKQHTVMVGFKFNTKTDKDILDRLAAVPNKQGYVKRLIRADMKKSRPDIDDMIESAEKEESPC